MIILLVLSCCWLVQEPSDQVKGPNTAEAVIDRYIQARGGHEVLSGLRSYTGVSEIFVDGQRIGKSKVFGQGDKFLMMFILRDGSVYKSGTDGNLVWQIDTDDQPMILEGPAATAYKLEKGGVHEALRWRTGVNEIEYRGRIQFRNQEVHELAFPNEGGVRRFFDVDSGHLVGSERQLDDDQKTILESEFKEYKQSTPGYWYPSRTIRRYGTDFTREFRNVSYEVNAEVDSKIFELPAAIAKLYVEKAEKELSR